METFIFCKAEEGSNYSKSDFVFNVILQNVVYILWSDSKEFKEAVEARVPFGMCTGKVLFGMCFYYDLSFNNGLSQSRILSV